MFWWWQINSVNVAPARSNACTSCTTTCTSTGLLKNKQYNVHEEILKTFLYAHVHVTCNKNYSTFYFERTNSWMVKERRNDREMVINQRNKMYIYLICNKRFFRTLFSKILFHQQIPSVNYSNLCDIYWKFEGKE